MQYELLSLLKCPLSKGDLRFELISEFKKSYDGVDVNEVCEGLLFSETGFVFPIINGIPRMLIESFYDYEDFFQKHLCAYSSVLKTLEESYPGLLQFCLKKNRKTKKSFELEWSFLNIQKDKLWHYELADLSTVFLNETGHPIEFFTGKTVIDVGSGHGLMTQCVAGFSKFSVGVELSRAVENAYLNNKNSRASFIQGDLHFLPFDNYTFDVLYSSGVIHHTPNTELSLSVIDPVLKQRGKICLWLYHPQKNILHHFIVNIRKLTGKLPVSVSVILLTVFVFPITFLVKKIKTNKAPNYREEMIDLLDYFTPEFRFETPHDLAKTWLQRRLYDNIKITTHNQFGFSISADKASIFKD